MSKILLAEDDLSTRLFLASTLEKAGHIVVACENGLLALEAFETAPYSYDLLLTDIVMPGLDGIELSSRLRATRPDLKTVFITGFAGMAPEDGNAKVFSKPFHLGNLTCEIEEMLRS